MYKILWIIAIVFVIAIALYLASIMFYEGGTSVRETIRETYSYPETTIVGNIVYLPLPNRVTNMSIEEALLLRRSLRDYTSDPITIEHLSMILWAAQGISNTKWGFRTAPSAGATYPLEIYVVVGDEKVLIKPGEYLRAGVYKYNVKTHSLLLIKEGDYRNDLAREALNQEWVAEAAVDIVICAVYERTTSRYGERGIRYVHIEVGHVGQNIYLMSTALGLGTVAVGAFFDDGVARVINAQENERPLYIMPIGVPVKPYYTTFDEINKYYIANRE